MRSAVVEMGLKLSLNYPSTHFSMTYIAHDVTAKNLPPKTKAKERECT